MFFDGRGGFEEARALSRFPASRANSLYAAQLLRGSKKVVRE